MKRAKSADPDLKMAPLAPVLDACTNQISTSPCFSVSGIVTDLRLEECGSDHHLPVLGTVPNISLARAIRSLSHNRAWIAPSRADQAQHYQAYQSSSR
eukprot:scaffold16758_cov57-Attheya_sp.AAC.2